MSLPPGANAIIAQRRGGMKPEAGVVVSFVGRTPYDDAPHVYPRGGETYDWRFLRDLQVTVVVKAGVDAMPALRGIFAQAIATTGYPWVVDLERQSLASLIDASPMRLWSVQKHSETWKAFFS